MEAYVAKKIIGYGCKIVHVTEGLMTSIDPNGSQAVIIPSLFGGVQTLKVSGGELVVTIRFDLEDKVDYKYRVDPQNPLNWEIEFLKKVEEVYYDPS